MMALPDFRKSFKIGLAVLIQYGRVTDSQPPSHVAYLRRAVKTRRSADADNRLDAFSGQSRSTNMVPFHMLHIVSYCVIVTLSLKFHDLEMGSKVTQGL